MSVSGFVTEGGWMEISGCETGGGKMKMSGFVTESGRMEVSDCETGGG